MVRAAALIFLVAAAPSAAKEAPFESWTCFGEAASLCSAKGCEAVTPSPRFDAYVSQGQYSSCPTKEWVGADCVVVPAEFHRVNGVLYGRMGKWSNAFRMDAQRRFEDTSTTEAGLRIETGRCVKGAYLAFIPALPE